MINFKALALTAIVALGGVATTAPQAQALDYPACATIERTDFPCMQGHIMYENKMAWYADDGGHDVRTPYNEPARQANNGGVPIFAILGADTSTGYNGPQSVSGSAHGCGSNVAIPNEFGGYDCY